MQEAMKDLDPNLRLLVVSDSFDVPMHAEEIHQVSADFVKLRVELPQDDEDNLISSARSPDVSDNEGFCGTVYSPQG
jgi:hypothetical protein